jgi:glycosyltransferase involved in cell wall biosynthesis
MKVVHINKTDNLGGAARAAFRLHKGLQCTGHDSTMFVLSSFSDDGHIRTFEKKSDILSIAQRGVRQRRIEHSFARYHHSRPGGLELFTDDRSSYAATLQPQIPSCQVINLHWVAGFLDYQSFFSSPRVASVPVVWTMHDLNAVTGGCHYDLGCERYMTGCGACPQLGSRDPQDLSFQVWARKQKLFTKLPASRLHVVTPSRWLGAEVKRSPLCEKFPVSVIPYGLDLQEFAPRDKRMVRDLLGIPQQARVLLFVAEEIGNQRKGFSLLVDALARCAKQIPDLTLLSLGQNKPGLDIGIPWIHVGSLNNDRFLSMVYSAADLFAICSLQDNLPNTVMEAMACGVAAVGYEIGGIPDMIRNNLTGRVIASKDEAGMAAAITELLTDKAKCREMGENARRVATAEYSLELQASRYAELYHSLVSSNDTSMLSTQSRN